jgi:hypothetical protein
VSIKILNEVWSNPPVSQGKLLVLLALADNADEEARTAWPSVKTLARKSVLSERQVQYCIKELAALGIIDVYPSAGPSGVNKYRVRKPSEWGGAKTAGGELHFTGGVKPIAPGGVKPIAPKPSIEPSIEPSYTPLPPKGDGYTAEFEEWWKKYPRKKNKGAAFKAFQRAKKIVGADRLFSALSEQLPFLEREAQRDGGQYCPHPASWLNAGSYDDEPPKPQTNLMTQIANGEYDPWNNDSENVLPLSQARLPRD